MNVDLVTIFFLPPKGETSATYPNHCLISTFHRFHLPDLHHHHHHQHIIINIASSAPSSSPLSSLGQSRPTAGKA